ncbi:hypothetical protein HNP49_003171 [Pseudomonas fluvialis]|uniref:DUF4136 domain-containing protein n=1 Tax=Pseudomonas fluvialis TaxID=1793966 RepID=A0A7X0BUV8_9PSED|nr:hypothetical protein [Pseudomonas fluvialis]MBB6342983.1 hypothetical protein [Pseudomonas fluvialis]
MHPAKTLVILIMSLVISACSTSHFAVKPSDAEGVSLKGTELYVYSFLDVRESFFGPNLLLEFSKQLSSNLNNLGVSTKISSFKETEVGKYYINTNADTVIPAQQAIAKNESIEKLYDTENRLIIFPSKMTINQAVISYEIRWELVDAKTGKIIWSTMSEGLHMNAWVPDEDPQPRAKKIVDAIITEMQRNRMI